MMQYKILVVDDDPNIREVLTVLLGSEGYVVDQAENGEIALEKIKEHKQVDLVILDIGAGSILDGKVSGAGQGGGLF